MSPELKIKDQKMGRIWDLKLNQVYRFMLMAVGHIVGALSVAAAVCSSACWAQKKKKDLSNTVELILREKQQK